MNQPNPDHARHDLILIAGHAAGDLVEADRDRADALLASCGDCSDLHGDLVAIASATRSLPAPKAPARDFRLTPAQAERLRRGSWLRAALRPFGAPRSTVRPMAAAFTSLGIAGLLVATALPALLGGGAASLAPERDTTGSAAGAPAATAAPAYMTAAPAPQAGVSTPNNGDYAIDAHGSTAPGATTAGAKAASLPPSSPGAVAVGGNDTGSVNETASPPQSAAASSPPNLLVLGSLALLAVGLVLFGLRFAGRRVR